MTETAELRWLHLSDIHVGVTAQAHVWPRFSTVFLDDLETAHRKVGGFDLLVFSGDIAQRGSIAEFDEFDKILERILDRLRDLGSQPPVVTVPGNHDIARPNPVSPAAMSLAQFWREPRLRQEMWEDDSPYLTFLRELFGNYSDWRRRAIKRGVHAPPITDGLLPGDASYVIEANGGRAGLACLNSTWLQLGAGNYDGELHVDARQLLAVTEGSPDDWVRGNDVNLLVTHQPASWLHPDRPASWDADINPAGRFDLHLFGHMHEPDVVSMSHGGGPSRRHVQAASLFGLETYGERQVRIQGYSANKITVRNSERIFTSWPRILTKMADGRFKMVPDNSQDIEETSGALTIQYDVERRRVAPSALTPMPTSTDGIPIVPRLTGVDFDLETIRHPFAEARGHLKVRSVEQDACAKALSDGRMVWIAADWGMGGDGFLSAICARQELPRDAVFALDFDEFGNPPSFADDLHTRYGATFQQMCDALADAGPCLLLLDDVDPSPEAERIIYDMLAAARDFAADAQFVVRSRRPPRGSVIPVVELKALDEPDVATYASESELGAERYAKPDAVSKLLRHTDGVPARLDDALRDLEFVSLGELLATNPDYGDAAALPANAPPALVATIGELARSDDRAEERAYNLLLALSALPRGEQLSRLTRFLGAHPIYPPHARALVERSLVETAIVKPLEGMPGDATQKKLFVPRPVRDYVRSVIGETMALSIDRRALSLYFGDDWSSGDIATSPTGKRVRNALCDGYEVENAITLILRSTRRALLDGSETEVEGLIRLATSFIAALITGDHFRSAALFCEDMLNLLEQFGRSGREVDVIRYELARSLRMTGDNAAARLEFERLDLKALSKSQRQSAELGMALALERLGEDADAAAAARRTIAIDRRSGAALQAKAILANQKEASAERSAELRRILAASRKGGFTTVENNIRLILAREERDAEKACDLLKEVIQAAPSSQDHYNSVRAIVELAERRSVPPGLTEREQSRLVDAYQFLFNERLANLFERCHAALWREFERAGQLLNLLNLFRHSSFIWRLNGMVDTETAYLAKLARLAGDMLVSGRLGDSRDGVYLIVRISVVLGDVVGEPTPDA